MNLLLVRTGIFPACTIGDLFVDGERVCYVLEDTLREVPGIPVAGWKVPGATAIPEGRYRVVIDQSARFGRPMPHLLNVPGFTGVRIHRGNDAKETEGCLLVGLSWDPSDPNWIGESAQAFGLLLPRLESAISSGQECWIEIRESTNLLHP
jgi:hypothetical protein